MEMMNMLNSSMVVQYGCQSPQQHHDRPGMDVSLLNSSMIAKGWMSVRSTAA